MTFFCVLLFCLISLNHLAKTALASACYLSVIIVTCGGADGADDRSVGGGVGEAERRILHREDLQNDGHQPHSVRRRQADKTTRRHLLNLAGFPTDRHACVPSSEAISCEDKWRSSRQTAHVGVQGCLCLTAQGDLTRSEAFASHNHFD